MANQKTANSKRTAAIRTTSDEVEEIMNYMQANPKKGDRTVAAYIYGQGVKINLSRSRASVYSLVRRLRKTLTPTAA